MSNNIRVTYAGLIGLVVGLVSVFTSLIFVLVVTRTLSPEEFGTWSLVIIMMSYFLIPDAIASFWSVRHISRNEIVGRTALFSSSIFSIGVIPLYLALSVILSTQSNANLNSLFFGAILIPVYFIHASLNSINRGHKPQVQSYSIFIFELIKIPFGFYFIFFLKMGVEGVILAVLFGFIGRIILQAYFARTKLRDKLKLSVLRRWIKLSWIPIYSVFMNLYIQIDVILYPIIIGSVIGVAYYNAAYIIAGVLNHVGMISSALYPKLLGGGKGKDIENNFVYLMYFGIPLLSIIILFSKPALFALNPIYMGLWVAVVFLAFKTFFLILNRTLYIILTGLETIDLEKNPTFSDLRKSNLFFAPSIRNIQLVLHLISISFLFVLLNNSGLIEEEIVIYWTFVSVIFEIPVFVYLWIRTQKNIKFNFPVKLTIKYIVSSMAFALIFFITSDSIINYKISIFEHLPSVLIELTICVSVYLAITYLIDKKTRKLFRRIILEIISKKN